MMRFFLRMLFVCDASEASLRARLERGKLPIAIFGAVVLSLTFAAPLPAQLPDAPQPPLSAQLSTQPQTPGAPTQTPSAGQTPTASLPPGSAITIEQAIDLAKKNNPTLQANRTLIQQNKAQEITANLRPNPLVSWDMQYLPIFEPSLFTESSYWTDTAQFDGGIGYLFERGKKRQHRLQAARDTTAVTESQVLDAERTTASNTAQLFVAALLAKSNLDFANTLLKSYENTVNISEQQYQAGAVSEVNLLKIKLQKLQFETDVKTAELTRKQALASLREALGFASVPEDFDVAGELSYEPVTLQLSDLQARAVNTRPDLQAAQRSVTAANSQVALAKANGKQDLDVSFNYTHVNDANLGAFYFNIPWALFNRNQGEIERTKWALTQSQFQQTAAEQQVFTDVKNAYEGVRSNEDLVKLYDKGYLKQAEEALEITRFSYQHGAASLLDFLDAERSFRSTELSYRQALASYMNALEQLRLAVGTRELQ